MAMLEKERIDYCEKLERELGIKINSDDPFVSIFLKIDADVAVSAENRKAAENAIKRIALETENIKAVVKLVPSAIAPLKSLADQLTMTANGMVKSANATADAESKMYRQLDQLKSVIAQSAEKNKTSVKSSIWFFALAFSAIVILGLGFYFVVAQKYSNAKEIEAKIEANKEYIIWLRKAEKYMQEKAPSAYNNFVEQNPKP